MAATAANLVFDTSSRDRIAAIPERLRKSFRNGRTRPIAWRLEQLRAVEKLLRENTDALQKALASDLGKPALEAMAADIGMPLGEASLAIKNLAAWRSRWSSDRASPGSSMIRSESS